MRGKGNRKTLLSKKSKNGIYKTCIVAVVAVTPTALKQLKATSRLSVMTQMGKLKGVCFHLTYKFKWPTTICF